MSIKVDPQKVDELSAQTKRFGEFVEREERNVYQTISQLIRETQSQYPELYGRSELNEVERLLREIRKQAEGITGELRDKAKVLREAAARYRKDEETAKGTKKQRYQPVPPSTYYSASGGLTGEGLTSYLEDALFQDLEVQKLHQLALHGTEKEKKEAKEKLDAIFKARNTIARAQVAYTVYKAFGNTYLMEQAHKEAMKQRGILKGYGISEELYGENVNISEYFKGSALEACSYDPSMEIVKDGKFVQVLMPEDNQYQYLLGLVLKGGAQGVWAHKQLDDIHKQLGEIGRAQVAWHEYKAKGMTKEMDGAHTYAEKVRGILKDKYGLSSVMVDGVGYKHLWTGAGPAGNYLKVQEIEGANTLKEANDNDLLSIAQQIVFGNEGGYGTVVKDDGKNLAKGYSGGISIGRLQWHEGRAYDLLLKIVKQDPDEAKRILGEQSKILKELNDPNLAKNKDRWKSKVPTDEQVKAISTLISTDIGKKAQDNQARQDMNSYLQQGKRLGIKDDKALVYFADLYNQSPKGAVRILNAIKAAGKDITLENIHKASLKDDVMGKYVSRRESTYSECSKMSPVSKSTIKEKSQNEIVNGKIEETSEGIRKFLSSAEAELAKGFKEHIPKGKKEGDNNTPYGKWYGANYQPWCAMFVSYCANEAGILGTVVPKYSNVEEGRKWYVRKGRFKDFSSDYTPKAGDVIFFRNGNQNHTGIITGYDSKTKTVYTIEGNTSDQVARRSYKLNQVKNIVGYGVNGGTGTGIVPTDASSGESRRTR